MSLDLGRIDITYVDKIGLLVGSWFISMTTGIEIVQVYHYFASYYNDHVVLKSAVAFLVSADITASILFYVSTHRQLVSVKVGSIEEYIPSLTLVCMPFVTSTIIAIVNLFLVWRYYKLTKRLWLCLCLCAVIAAALSCHFWALSLAVKLRSLKPSDIQILGTLFDQASKAADAGLSMEVGLVCLIWLLILAHLLTLLKRDMQDAKRIVVRLLVLTLESGTVASIVSIATLAYYMRNPTSSNLQVIGFFMSRVYFMNMLFNLNVRKTGQVMKDASLGNRTHRTTGTSGHGDILPLSHLPCPPPEAWQFQHSIVHVNRSVETKVDKETQESDSQSTGPRR